MKKHNFCLIIFLTVTFLSGCSFEGTNTPNENTAVPRSPSPVNDALNQPLSVTLSWAADNVDFFDVYFDSFNPPQTLYAKDITSKSILIPGLNPSAKYFWKVVSKKDGSINNGPVWSFTTKERTTENAGYVLIKHNIETQLPNFVNLMFQVLNVESVGVDSLVKDNFNVLEDGQQISPTESELDIWKRSQTPYTLKTVLMLDNSTSLTPNIDDIKNAALNLIDNLVPQQEVAVYSFSEGIYLLQDFTSDKTTLKQAIQQNYQLGFPTTNLYGAVIHGASQWEDVYTVSKIVQGFMIVFTDGSDTQGSSTLQEAINETFDKKVYTVRLGTEIDETVLNFLGNAGAFSINNAGELSQKFLDIQDDIVKYANSFYLLKYRSPKRGDFNHILQVSIKNNPNNSFITGEFNSKNFSSY